LANPINPPRPDNSDASGFDMSLCSRDFHRQEILAKNPKKLKSKVKLTMITIVAIAI